MNYLAHALLAPPGALDVAANLMGDFVRGRLDGRFAPRVAAGIRLHRRIDTWTDNHPVHTQSRNRLEPPFRRYAGVLIDIYYDHFLARHFDRFSPIPLDAFSREVYDALDRHRALLPEPMQRFAGHMRRVDLLSSYADLAGIERALAGVSRRAPRGNPLADGARVLGEHHAAFERDFLAFFPELMDWAGRPAESPAAEM